MLVHNKVFKKFSNKKDFLSDFEQSLETLAERIKEKNFRKSLIEILKIRSNFIILKDKLQD